MPAKATENEDLSVMSGNSANDVIEEAFLNYDVCDAVLETAAGSLTEKAGAFTLAFCSGFDTCPS
jgi:hypothetical protein